MANLIVRNVDDEIARALKTRASEHGVSAEAEHRQILEQVLMRPKKKNFIELIAEMPDVGEDGDFVRRSGDSSRPVFD